MAKKNECIKPEYRDRVAVVDLRGTGIEVHGEVAYLEVESSSKNPDFPATSNGYQKIGVVMDGVLYHDSRINSITIDLPIAGPTAELEALMNKHGVE